MSTHSQTSAGSADAVPQDAPTPEPPSPDAAWQPDGQFRSLDPNYVRVERIGAWISLGVLTGIALAALVFAALAGWLSGWWLAIASVAGLLLLTLVGWFSLQYPRWAYRHIRYAVSPRGIEIHSGILWRGIVHVPRSRVQHVDVIQGPLARRYGISTLQIYTAGTENNEVDLEGLAHDVALGIRDYLVGESTSHGS